MYCKNCGAQYEDAKFCPKCGTSTDEVKEVPQTQPPVQQWQPYTNQQTQKKKLKRWQVAVIVIAGLFVIGIIGNLTGEGSENAKDINTTDTSAAAYEKNLNETSVKDYISTEKETEIISTFDTEDTPTTEQQFGASISQENALRKANDYLDYSAFSYQGLIEQLEYEGFNNEDAVYGVDNCGADWNEQAAIKAKDYLDYSAFSYQGLVEQLEYEGFTHEQAVFGAHSAGL